MAAVVGIVVEAATATVTAVALMATAMAGVTTLAVMATAMAAATTATMATTATTVTMATKVVARESGGTNEGLIRGGYVIIT